MECKLQPAVVPWRVTLKPDGIIEIDTHVIDLPLTLKSEELCIYLEAVCVVTPLAIDSSTVTSIKGWLDEGKNWWSDEGKYWYELPDISGSVVPTISSDFIDITDDEDLTFSDIDMSAHFPVVYHTVLEEYIPEDINRDWKNIKDLTYITYIRIDTQQMATDYGITIADEYKYLMSVATIGTIYQNSIESENIIYVDDRFPDVAPELGAPLCEPDTSGMPDSSGYEVITRGTPGP
jgi:hypothetical protein